MRILLIGDHSIYINAVKSILTSEFDREILHMSYVEL